MIVLFAGASVHLSAPETILQAGAVKGLRTSVTQTLDSTVLTRLLCMAISCTERRSALQVMC